MTITYSLIHLPSTFTNISGFVTFNDQLLQLARITSYDIIKHSKYTRLKKMWYFKDFFFSQCINQWVKLRHSWTSLNEKARPQKNDYQGNLDCEHSLQFGSPLKHPVNFYVRSTYRPIRSGSISALPGLHSPMSKNLLSVTELMAENYAWC